MLHPALFLGIAYNYSNKMNYYMKTKVKYSKIIIRSNVKLRMLNIGTRDENIINNLDLFDF